MTSYRNLNFLAILCLPMLLGSCYCFNKTGPSESSIRHLRTSKPAPPCRLECGGGPNSRSYQLNGYYGVPKTVAVRDSYINNYTDSNTADYSLSSIGQFGIRFERYMGSFITNFPVLGLGIDYSQAYSTFNNTPINSTYGSQYNLTHHRAMLSLNHMTWVRSKMIGYLTLQGGIGLVQRNFSSDDPLLQNSKATESPTFAYRVGYGFQFYMPGPWGIALEGGYGGGAYGRVGLFWWIF